MLKSETAFDIKDKIIGIDMENEDRYSLLRANRILKNSIFIENIEKIERLEEHRIFCRHGVEHLLDVARIAYIDVLEDGLDIRKDVVYATALLHDIGRAVQYETGEPHDMAGVRLAKQILADCGFDEPERRLIIAAIGNHRRDDVEVTVENIEATKNSMEGKENVSGEIELSNKRNIAETIDKFCEIIYKADKASRLCFECGARVECNWSADKMNMEIRDNPK